MVALRAYIVILPKHPVILWTCGVCTRLFYDVRHVLWTCGVCTRLFYDVRHVPHSRMSVLNSVLAPFTYLI